jgi:hypothetical protein
MAANRSRRQFLVWSVAASALAGASARATLVQQQVPGRPFPTTPSENSSQNPNQNSNTRRDASQPGDVSPAVPDPKTVLKANDKDIKHNVRELATLAEELKKEVEDTDSASVLSLGMVHKAEEIEKLARHIASLARG